MSFQKLCAALATAVSLLTALPAWAACGPASLLDHVFINEFYFDANLFLEIYVDDTTRWDDLSGYSVVIYKQADSTTKTNDDPVTIPLADFSNTVSGGDPHFRYYVPTASEQSFFSPDSNVVMGIASYANKQVQLDSEIDLVRVGSPSIPTYYPTTCASFSSPTDPYHNISIPGSLAAKNVARIADGEAWYLMPGTGSNTSDSQGVSNVVALGLTFTIGADPATTTVNGESVVTLTITNGSSGSSAITYDGASVDIALETGLSQASGQAFPWIIGNLAPGGSASTTLNVTAAAANTYSVTATLSFNYTSSANTANVVIVTSVPITFTQPPVALLRIRHDGSGSVCTREAIHIDACVDAACTVLYSGAVSLTMAPGTWWDAASGGAAANSFSFSGGTTTRYLEYTTAATATLAASDVTPLPNAVSCQPSCAIGFASASLVFSEDLSNRVAGSDIAVAGRPHDFRVSLVRWDGSNPPPSGCGIDTSYSGTKSLSASFLPAPTHLAVAAAPIAAGTELSASGVDLSLTFTNGTANFDLDTIDIGKYALAFSDAAYGDGAGVSGTSNELTVRPFALASAVAVSVAGTTAALASAGAVTASAGDALTASVRAVRWSAADDSDNDGVPDAGADLADNALTASFGITIPLSAVDVAPALSGPGDPGLRESDTSGGTWSYGAWSGNVHFDNVGAMRLQAGPLTSFLGTALTVPVASSDAVGRFRPHHFGVTGGALTAGCGAGSTLTYVGQDFAVGFTVQALNALGLVASNYGRSGYAPLATGGGLTLLATQGGSSFDSATSTGVLPNATVGPPAVLQIPASVAAGGWSEGEVGYAGSSGQTAAFALDRPAAPNGPFDGMNVAVRVADTTADAVPFWGDSTVLVEPACAAGATCVAPLGATDMRYGRIAVGNAFGSEKLALPVPAAVQYWTGNYWATNTLDQGCTTLPAPTISNPDVTVNAGSVMTTSVASPGVFQLVLNAGAVAEADLGFDVSAWLQYPADPAAKVKFGIYGGSNRFIYRREVR